MRRVLNDVQSALLLFCLVFFAGCSKNVAELQAQAKALEGEGQLRAAIISVKEALQIEPNNGTLRFTLGRLYNAHFEPVAAESELKKALKLGSVEGGRVALELALALRAQEKFDELLKRVMTDPDFESSQQASILALRGSAQYVLRIEEDAAKSLQDSAVIEPDNPDVKLLAAQIRAGAGDFKEALTLIEQTLAKNPSNYYGWSFKGQLLNKMGLVDEAVAAFGEVVKLNPIDFRALLARSNLLMRQTKLDEAEKDLQVLSTAFKGNPQVLVQLGVLQLMQKRPQDALQQALLVLSGAPKMPEGALVAGLAYFALGADLQADEFLTRYLAKRPQAKFARIKLAETRNRLGEPSRALEVLDPLLTSAQPGAFALTLGAEARLKLGDTETAMKLYDLSTQAEPDNPNLKIRRAAANLYGGDEAAGLEELAAAVQFSKQASQADELLVTSLLARKRVDDAMNAVERLEKRAPNAPITLNLRGVILIAKGEFEEARKAFEASLAVDPAFFPAAANLAHLDIRAGHPDAAHKHFARILEANSKNVEAMMAIAELDLQNNKREDAIAMLSRAAKANPRLMQAHILLVALYQASGQKQLVLSAADAALVANPTDERAIVMAAEAQLSQGLADKAIATYAQILNADEESTDAISRVAAFQAQAGLPHESERTLRNALQRYPEPNLQIALISLLVAQDRLGDATAYVGELQAAHPEAPLGNLLEGEIYEASGKYEAAVGAYDLALKKQPIGAFAVKRYSAQREAKGEQVALSELKNWVKSNPTDLFARAKLGDISLQRGNFAIAAENYEAILATKNIPIDTLNNLAMAYLGLKDSRALEVAQAARNAAPNSPVVLDTLGWIMAEQGDFVRGLENLARARLLAPDSIEIRYHWASVSARAGNFDDARKELKALIKNSQESIFATEAKLLLEKLEAEAAKLGRIWTPP